MVRFVVDYGVTEKVPVNLESGCCVTEQNAVIYVVDFSVTVNFAVNYVVD